MLSLRHDSRSAAGRKRFYAAARQARQYPLASAEGLRLHNVSAEPVTLQGKKGLRVRMSEEAGRPFIKRALEQGINFFDTAQGYGFGASEGLLASALKGRPRDQFIIATKGGLARTGPDQWFHSDGRSTCGNRFS